MSLAAFYFFHTMAIGVSLPYLGPYLRGLGLHGTQISALVSLTPALHLFVPLLWGWLADRTQRPARVLKLASLGLMLATLPLMAARRFETLLPAYFGYAFFLVPIGGLADSLAGSRVRAGGDYGRIRMWGSIGFIVSAIGAGIALGLRQAGPSDLLVPAAMGASLIVALAVALAVPESTERSARPEVADLRLLLADRRLRVLLVAAALHWACAAPYHSFFGIFLRDRQFSPAVVGLAFSIGVAAEAVAFFAFRSIRRIAELETILAVVMAASALRWVVTALVNSATVLVLMQSLHGLTYGLFWAASVSYVVSAVPARLRATGQTVFTASVFGVGAIAGYFVTGILYDVFNGAGPSFLAAGIFELIPLAVVLVARRRHRRSNAATPDAAAAGDQAAVKTAATIDLEA